jgi:hypothetical protein
MQCPLKRDRPGGFKLQSLAYLCKRYILSERFFSITISTLLRVGENNRPETKFSPSGTKTTATSRREALSEKINSYSASHNPFHSAHLPSYVGVSKRLFRVEAGLIAQFRL